MICLKQCYDALVPCYRFGIYHDYYEDHSDAIRMQKETPQLPGFDRGRMWITQDELLNWQPRKDVAKPYPAAGRQREADKP